MFAPEDKTPRLRCPHCGNRTPHDYLHDEVISCAIGPKAREFEHRRWALVRCHTCREVSLYGDRFCTRNHNSDPVKVIDVHDLGLKWPDLSLPESVPNNVRAAYEEALKVKQHSANAFANQIRKALEAVCNDREAKGDNLHNMLGNLEGRGEIPSQLGEMTDLIRMVGNAGSHADRFEVDYRFVEPIDDFFQTAVRYIYELSNQIEQVQREYNEASQKPADEGDEDESEVSYDDLFGELDQKKPEGDEGNSEVDVSADDLFGGGADTE